MVVREQSEYVTRRDSRAACSNARLLSSTRSGGSFENKAQVTWRELIKPIVQNDWHLRSVASGDACAVGALTSLLSQLCLAEYDLLCATVLALE